MCGIKTQLDSGNELAAWVHVSFRAIVSQNTLVTLPVRAYHGWHSNNLVCAICIFIVIEKLLWILIRKAASPGLMRTEVQTIKWWKRREFYTGRLFWRTVLEANSQSKSALQWLWDERISLLKHDKCLQSELFVDLWERLHSHVTIFWWYDAFELLCLPTGDITCIYYIYQMHLNRNGCKL